MGELCSMLLYLTVNDVFKGMLPQHFKPALRWTFREEAHATRRTDTRIFLWMVFMFLSLNIVSLI